MTEAAPILPTDTPADRTIDEIEAALLGFPAVDCDTRATSYLTDGLYIRGTLLKAGEIWTSRIHRREGPFFVLKGEALVFDEQRGPQFVRAPFFGITPPGTRRVLVIVRDTVWFTVHPRDNDQADIQRIVDDLTIPRDIAQSADDQLILSAIAAARELSEKGEPS